MKVAILILLYGFNAHASDLKSWIERLAKHESQNISTIKRLDKNGRYSYGCLQFQQITFVSQVKRYGLASIEASDADVMRMIYDCEFQKCLASRMIIDCWRNYQHWWNAVKVIGRPPRR